MTKLPLEELIESLMTYEINLVKKQQEGEDKKKKNIALKVTANEEEEVEEEKQSEEDEDLALITRNFNKFMRGENFRGRRFTSRRDFSKKESSSHVTRRDEKRKKTWCVSSARNRDTLNIIVLYTEVKPRRERIRQ